LHSSPPMIWHEERRWLGDKSVLSMLLSPRQVSFESTDT
jgi:hypothetical protein